MGSTFSNDSKPATILKIETDYKKIKFEFFNNDNNLNITNEIKKINALKSNKDKIYKELEIFHELELYEQVFYFKYIKELYEKGIPIINNNVLDTWIWAEKIQNNYITNLNYYFSHQYINLFSTYNFDEKLYHQYLNSNLGQYYLTLCENKHNYIYECIEFNIYKKKYIFSFVYKEDTKNCKILNAVITDKKYNKIIYYTKHKDIINYLLDQEDNPLYEIRFIIRKYRF